MWEFAISQPRFLRSAIYCYVPILNRLFVRLVSLATYTWLILLKPGEATNVVRKGQETINRIAGQLIQEKKRKIEQDGFSGRGYDGKDLLSLLRTYSISVDPSHRILTLDS